MYAAVRDGCLHGAAFPTLRAGMDAVGVNAVELAIDRQMQVVSVDDGWDTRVALTSAAALAAYRQELDAAGLRATELMLSNDFSRPDLADEVAWVVRCTGAAAALGARAMRIEAAMNAHQGSWDETKCRAVFTDCMKRVLEATDDFPVVYGIENHGVQGNRYEFLSKVIDGVGSPRFGMTLDTANFYWSGMPLSEVHRVIEQLAPATRHTHVKNINYPADQREVRRQVGWRYEEYSCALPDGDIDIPLVIEQLRSAGYRGSLCIENESLGRYPERERQGMLRREAAYLEECLQG